MEPIITVSSLRKTFGTIHAVDGISFSVPQGSLFAFLGPNGAGKSTTIDMICTLTAFDGGSAKIAGYTLGTQDSLIRSSIGAVFQDSLLDNLLTVKENLWIRGSFYGLPREVLRDNIQMAVQATGVGDLLDRPYGKLSGGQRRRCDIARALANAPKVLFLDEPTTGLDPQTRRNVWDTITALQKKTGMTVFLTTHYMEEASLADQVVMIDHGKIIAQGTPQQLKERYTTDRLMLFAKDAEAVCARLDGLSVRYERLCGGRVEISLASTMDALPILDQISGMLEGFEVVAGSMDDVFLSVFGKEMRE